MVIFSQVCAWLRSNAEVHERTQTIFVFKTTVVLFLIFKTAFKVRNSTLVHLEYREKVTNCKLNGTQNSWRKMQSRLPVLEAAVTVDLICTSGISRTILIISASHSSPAIIQTLSILSVRVKEDCQFLFITTRLCKLVYLG